MVEDSSTTDVGACRRRYPIALRSGRVLLIYVKHNGHRVNPGSGALHQRTEQQEEAKQILAAVDQHQFRWCRESDTGSELLLAVSQTVATLKPLEALQCD